MLNGARPSRRLVNLTGLRYTSNGLTLPTPAFSIPSSGTTLCSPLHYVGPQHCRCFAGTPPGYKPPATRSKGQLNPGKNVAGRKVQFKRKADSTVPRNRKGTLLVTDEESSPGVPGDSRVMVAKGKQKAALVKPRRPAAPGGRPVRLTRDQQARKSVEEAEANKPLMNRGLVDELMRAGIEEVRLVVEPDEPGKKSESRVCSLDEAVEVARDEMDVDLVLVTPKETLLKSTPVVKAVDYNRMMYAKKKREKELAKSQPKAKPLKEIKFGAAVEANDLERKLAQTMSHLSKGHPVKCTLTARKRELTLNPSCVKDLQVIIFSRLEPYVNKDSSRKLPGFNQTKYQVTFTPRSDLNAILAKEEREKDRIPV